MKWKYVNYLPISIQLEDIKFGRIIKMLNERNFIITDRCLTSNWWLHCFIRTGLFWNRPKLTYNIKLIYEFYSNKIFKCSLRYYVFVVQHWNNLPVITQLLPPGSKYSKSSSVMEVSFALIFVEHARRWLTGTHPHVPFLNTMPPTITPLQPTWWPVHASQQAWALRRP